MDDNVGLSIVLISIFSIFLLTALLFAFNYKVAESEAKLYNETYNKNYTAKDFFFAGKTIKDYLNKGQNRTLNINADLNKD